MFAAKAFSFKTVWAALASRDPAGLMASGLKFWRCSFSRTSDRDVRSSGNPRCRPSVRGMWLVISVVEEELLSVYWKNNVQDSSDDFKLDQIHA